MKHLKILVVLLLVAAAGFGQSTLPLRADTVVIEKVGGSAELKIKNRTRDSLGLMINMGGGRTEFRKAKVLNDSTLVIGLDTLVIKGGASGGRGGGTGNISGSLTAGRVTLSGGSNTVTDDAGLTYISAQNKLFTDSIAVSKAVSNFYRLNPTLFFNPPDSVSLYGHSYVVGQNASTFGLSFGGRMVDHYQLPFVNHAVGGRGIWETAKNHHQYLNPGHKAMTLVMTMLNDVRRGGAGYKTHRKIIGGYNSIIANHFLKSWTPAGATTGSINRYGTWFPGYLSSTVGGKSVGNGAFTSTLNDSIVYTFNDSTILLGLIGGDSVSGVNYNYAVFDIYLDDVLYDTKSEGNMTDGISDGNNDNGRSPFAIIIRGLTLGSHKIKLVNKTSGAFFVVDYFGHLKDASQATPFLAFHDPRLDATGYATVPDQANDAIIDGINASLDSLRSVQWYGYPFFIARTNDYFIPSLGSGLASDHIHQTDLGGQQIATGGTVALPAVTIDADNNSLLASESRVYYKAADRINLLAYYDEVVSKTDTNNFILNTPAFQQIGNININGTIRNGGPLFSGNTTSTSATAPAARFFTGGPSMFNFYKFGTENYLFSSDTTSTTGVNLNMPVGNFLKIGTLSGGTYTPFASFDNSATNKLVLTGNAIFSSTVRIGNAVAAGNAPVTLGTYFSLPGLTTNRPSAGTDFKNMHFRSDDTSTNIVLINDAESLSNYAFRIIRNGYTAKNTQLFGEVMIGSQSDQGAYTLQNTGGSYQNGPIYLAGQNTGLSSMKLLVKGTDSLVYQIDPSTIAAPSIPQSLVPFGNASNAQTTSANLRYVDSMSTLSSIGVLAKSYAQVGDSSVNVQSSKTSIFFGNSLFAGTTINPSYLRAATQIANITNTQEENRAIGGTRMRALTGTDSSMENRVYIIPTFNAGVFKYLFFEYGTNDILSTSVDTAAYRTAYNGVIDNATGKGWPLANIVVVGPGIIIDANPTIQARVAQIASITKDLATKKGVVYADTYKAMTARGGTALLTADNVHHTERGVQVWVDAVSSAIGGIGGTARVNGYLTAGMLNLYQMKNPGNASVLTAYDSTYRPFIELRGKYQGTNQDAFGLGLDAMKSLTTGINNVAVGGKSMQTLADGSGNTAIGFNTLNAAVSSASNTAVGLNVLRVATSNENTGVGRDALYSLTTGTGNTSIGYYSLRSLVNSSFNAAFGYYSFNGATGGNNAGLGANSGRGTTSGANNTAVGATALFSNQTGAANTGVGYRALRGAGGDNNTGIGAFAFDSLTSSAVANVGIGYRAGYRSKGVLSNTFIGPFAGQNNTTGNQNTGIGGYNGKDSTLNKQVWLSTGDQVVSYYADVPNFFSGAFTESPQYAWDINGKLGIRSVSNGTGSDSVLVINNNEVKKVSSTLFGSLAVPSDRLVFGTGSATTHSVNFTVDSNTTVKNLNVGVQSGSTGFVNLGNSNGSAANGVLANGTLILQSTTSNVNYNAQPGFLHAWQFGALGGSLSKRMELNIQQLEVKTNLFIDSLNNGTSSDSILVINNREVKKVSAPVLDAADYTPTLTGITNVDGVTLTSAHYMRINDQVTVDLMVSIDPTTLATNTNVDITLPVASTMTNLTNLTGLITSATGGTGNVVAVGNKARVGFDATTTSNQVFNIHFMYRIQ